MRVLRKMSAVLAALVVVAMGVAGSASFQATTRHVATLHSTMLGANEVPGPGDPNASGWTIVVANAGTGQVCFVIKVAGLSEPVTKGHIHVGRTGTAGPVVIPFPLTPPMTMPGSHVFAGCTNADKSLIQEIIDNPSEYYTNVHNASYPAGAMRGQLQPFAP